MNATADAKNRAADAWPAQESASFKQARAVLTREHLLDAARDVFARDGFEHARIEDIAAMAGKTRGAFYNNFKDKEDVFFAIFEEELDEKMAYLRPLLQALPTLDERLTALARWAATLCHDRQRTLLIVEFKLYAIRHPQHRKRLADLHAAMRQRCALPEIDDMLPELARQSVSEQRTGSLLVGAVMDGLAVNRLFDPGAFTDEQLVQYLDLCIRETLALEPIAR